MKLRGRHKITSRVTALEARAAELVEGVPLSVADLADVAMLARPIALLADGANEPPKELRLFTAGIVKTTKGDFLFDGKSADSVMAAWHDLGRDLPFDYGHASHFAIFSSDPAEGAKAAGWFQLAVRDGECWAVNCQWTPKGRQKILDREFRYLSPTFRHTIEEDEDEPQRILEIYDCALTNDPATKKARPVLTHRADSPPAKEHTMLKLLAARLGLLETATEAEILSAVVALGEKLKTAASAFLALAGKPTEVEALAVFTAWKAGNDRVAELTQKLSDLEKARQTAALSALIEKGKADGKIPPALEPWAKTQTIESLTAFLGAAVAVPKDGHKPPEAGKDGNGGTVTELSDEHKKIAAQIGVKPEDVLKRFPKAAGAK